MRFSQKFLKEASENCSQKIEFSQDNVQWFDEPFKHLVIDDFFPEELAISCYSHFPDANSEVWSSENDTDIEIKSRTTWLSEFDVPEGIVDGVRLMNSAPFLKAMSKKFDIPKIIPDPYFTGGGLNMTKSGGLLDVHVDGNYHDATGLNRRLNAILYLNKDWQESHGGEFGLYDKTGEECVKKVPPIYNRLVVFDTHDYSFHGLPDPISFPEGKTRNSIILYYYTKAERPSHLVKVSEPHSALWVKRELKDKRGNKTRTYE